MVFKLSRNLLLIPEKVILKKLKRFLVFLRRFSDPKVFNPFHPSVSYELILVNSEMEKHVSVQINISVSPKRDSLVLGIGNIGRNYWRISHSYVALLIKPSHLKTLY